MQLKGFDFSLQFVWEAISKGMLVQHSLLIPPDCNFECVYCLMDSRPGFHRPGELTPQEMVALLEATAQLGAKTWYIAGEGEPLLWPNLTRMVELANSLGQWVVIATNGELLDTDKAAQLFDLDVSIVTKFNSFNPKTFSRLVGREATFVPYNGPIADYQGRLIPKGVASLIRAGYNLPGTTRAGLETVVVPTILAEIPEIYEFGLRHNFWTNVERCVAFGRAKEHPEVLVSDTSLQSLWRELTTLELELQMQPPPLSMDSDLAHYRCIDCRQRLKTQVVIRSDGEVYRCFTWVPELYLGNIRGVPLADLLQKKLPYFEGSCACFEFAK